MDTTNDNEMMAKHAENARNAYQNVTNEIFELSESNKSLVSSNEAYPVAGTAIIAVGFIWGNLTIDITYTSGEKAHFYGEHWGVGLIGAVIGVAGLLSVPESELIGNCSYQITATSVLTTI